MSSGINGNEMAIFRIFDHFLVIYEDDSLGELNAKANFPLQKGISHCEMAFAVAKVVLARHSPIFVRMV